MNDGTGMRRGLRWCWWRRAALLAIVAGLALLTAACGSSSSPRPGPGSYSACMRKHGVTGALAAPLPTSMPTFMPTSRNGRGRGVRIPAKESAAMQACQSLAPRPGQGSGQG
jgi:hypothetical protein